MARIAGINIPLNKHIVIGLTSIYGIGNSRARQICAAAGVKPDTEVKNLAEPEVASLRTAVTIPIARLIADARAVGYNLNSVLPQIVANHPRGLTYV